MRARVTLKVDVETYSQAAAAFALSGLGSRTVLQQSFDAADLVGKPVSVSAFVQSAGRASIPFGATTFTYTPYLLIGQGDDDVTDDPIVVGSDFQDVLTNFPLGSQLVTGITLSIDLQASPFTAVEHHERMIYDRIGFAARQQGGPVDVSGPPAPVVTDFDVTTVNVLPGRLALEAFAPQHARLAAVQNALQALAPGLAAITPGATYTADQVVLLRQLSERTRAVAVANAETLTMGYLATTDAAEAQLARGYLVRTVVETPRVVLAISRKQGDDATLELDVQQNRLSVFPLTGQMPSVTSAFEVARGLEASFLEGAVIAGVTGQSPVSIREVFQAVIDSPGNDLTVITSDDLDELDGLALSAEAKARIAAAAAQGKVIVTPIAMVTVGGQQTVGWLETEQGGRTISAFEHGGHQALVGYTGALEFSAEFNKPIAHFIGKVAAFGQVGLVYSAAVLDAVVEGGGFGDTIKDTKTSIKELIAKTKEATKNLRQAEESVREAEARHQGPRPRRGARQGSHRGLRSRPALLRLHDAERSARVSLPGERPRTRRSPRHPGRAAGRGRHSRPRSAASPSTPAARKCRACSAPACATPDPRRQPSPSRSPRRHPASRCAPRCPRCRSDRARRARSACAPCPPVISRPRALLPT